MENTLNTLLDGLRDLYQSDQSGYGRERIIQEQAKYACAFARENDLFIDSAASFEEITSSNVIQGSEHLVEYFEEFARIVKITIPKGFGLTPALMQHPVPHAEYKTGSPSVRHSIEFIPATPLEYLARWNACNEIFQDDVRLESVIQWPDQRISFAISQPQYAGRLPSHDDIFEYFCQAGWTRIKNDLGHGIFYNYAHETLALDIEPRNCYISEEGNLLPFDIILSHPDPELESYLQLF